MKRTGNVVEIRNGDAVVILCGGEGCNSCKSKNSCFALAGGKTRETQVIVSNELGAKTGDLVELEMAPSVSMTLIITTFLVPVIMLAIGYSVMMDGSDMARAAGAGIGLCIGIIISIVVNKRLTSKRKCNFRMTTINK
ncbi:MAG: SoxR reducing system RseC family protein [FCB group bacterium]|nr:SoxR reducing system RseC family protein [FCB group bacterium]